MDIYKLQTDSKIIKKITKENIETDTKKDEPYFIKGRISPAVVCPSCNNPILIIGLYGIKRPYGRHHQGDIKNIARYNQYAYNYCPYANPDWKPDKNARKSKDDAGNKILKILLEQFDRVIYILNKETGIYLATHTARNMLEMYMNLQGYKYVAANLINIPWVFGYMSASVSIYKERVNPDSEFAKTLSKLKYIKLDDNNRILSANNEFLNIKLYFLNHHIKRERDAKHIYLEAMDMMVSVTRNDESDVIFKKEIVFQTTWFNHLICLPKEKEQRSFTLLELAKEYIKL